MAQTMWFMPKPREMPAGSRAGAEGALSGERGGELPASPAGCWKPEQLPAADGRAAPAARSPTSPHVPGAMWCLEKGLELEGGGMWCSIPSLFSNYWNIQKKHFSLHKSRKNVQVSDR